MASTFTPSPAVDNTKEKDWPMYLGMLDWDSTKIVFTKRSLVEFLKYTGVTVDPGFTNIQKLPRYARFGNLTTGVEAEETTEEITVSTVQSPSRSGVQQLVENEFPDDALSTAPPRPSVDGYDPKSGGFKPSRRVRTIPGGADSIGNMFSDDSVTDEQFVPTRRVRQRPGGQDNIEGLF